MHFPTPKDGISITAVSIDENNHLICTMSDGSTIDAGELPGGNGGGIEQYSSITNFPSSGEDNILYLAKDTETLYYWTGSKYSTIASNTLEILAKLETAKIEFDGIEQTFNLPINDVALNVYVNGMYLTEDTDYTIDRTVKPNTITFTDLWEDIDTCTITYLKPVSGGDVPVLEFATDADIDKLFKEDIANGN